MTALNIIYNIIEFDMGSRTVGKLYPIPLDDYPKLLRYRVSEKGIYYIEDLVREMYVEQKELSLNKLTQLGILLKTYICQTQRIDEEVMFNDVSNRAKKYGGVNTPFIKDVLKSLMMRDLIGHNPRYDPRIALGMHHKII